MEEILKNWDCFALALGFLGSLGTGVPALVVLANKIRLLKGTLSIVQFDRREVLAVVNTLIKAIESYAGTVEKADAEDLTRLKTWIHQQAVAHGSEKLLHHLVKTITEKPAQVESEPAGVL